jgi:hypothetical protein
MKRNISRKTDCKIISARKNAKKGRKTSVAIRSELKAGLAWGII